MPTTKSVRTISPVDVVVIPTCGRPHALERSLNSLQANLQRNGRSPDILIADGSEDCASEEITRSIIERAGKFGSFKISLTDNTSRLSLARHLVPRNNSGKY